VCVQCTSVAFGGKASPVPDTHASTGAGAGAGTGQPGVLDIVVTRCCRGIHANAAAHRVKRGKVPSVGSEINK